MVHKLHVFNFFIFGAGEEMCHTRSGETPIQILAEPWSSLGDLPLSSDKKGKLFLSLTYFKAVLWG